jgi:hypothetical protein
MDVLDEGEVLRTLVLVEELDAELDRTARGDGAALAPAFARAVLARIDALATAAASCRTPAPASFLLRRPVCPARPAR